MVCSRFVQLMSLVIVLFSFSGCAIVDSPVGNGALFTRVKGPVIATSAKKAATKKGEGSAMNILGLIAIGDATIDTAKTAAGITNVTQVDYEAFSILGLYSEFTVKVHGN